MLNLTQGGRHDALAAVKYLSDIALGNVMIEAAPIRVLIADDHPVVRHGMTAILSSKPDITVVAQASNGRAAIDLFRQHQPDVTLIDLRMPQISGVEAIALIRQEVRNARFVILTTYDTDEDIYQGLSAGAMAYLLKGTPADELVDTIRAVHAGQSRIPAEVAAKLANRVSTPDLTPRELDVLHWVVAGQSNKQISVTLHISEGTVRAHINNILSKLGVRDRTQATTQAIRRGLVHLE
jgi:two-component system NarL family response regulator